MRWPPPRRRRRSCVRCFRSRCQVWTSFCRSFVWRKHRRRLVQLNGCYGVTDNLFDWFYHLLVLVDSYPRQVRRDREVLKIWVVWPLIETNRSISDILHQKCASAVNVSVVTQTVFKTSIFYEFFPRVVCLQSALVVVPSFGVPPPPKPPSPYHALIYLS